MLRIIEITSSSQSGYSHFQALYSSSFPIFEQRTEAQQQQAFAHSNYHLLTYWEGDLFVGFISYWAFEGYRYIEHFAINQEIRGGGYGSRVLSLFKADSPTILLLEIDPPVDAIAQSRLRFYQRNGFVSNPYAHKHPPYREGYEAHPLVVLTTDRPISEAEMRKFQGELASEVMNFSKLT